MGGDLVLEVVFKMLDGGPFFSVLFLDLLEVLPQLSFHILILLVDVSDMNDLIFS